MSHKQINRLPAELPPPTKTQMHLTLKSCLPTMTLYIAMSGGSPPRLPRHTLERQQINIKKTYLCETGGIHVEVDLAEVRRLLCCVGMDRGPKEEIASSIEKIT